MKRSPGGSSHSSRAPQHTPLRLNRLAVAAVGGAVVAVTAVSQIGGAPVAVAPASAPTEAASTSSAGLWAAPTDLPQAATLAAAKPSVERAARLVRRGGPSRTVAAVGAPDEADLTHIPTPALAAYQRAAAVIGEAKPSCALDWELLAAIGRVESDHGRRGGGGLSDRGVAKPAIIGVALTGEDGTRRIADSDAGELDGDQALDRAVGPMQFIPSTWSVVGVDADGDGERNPQDIDDAALAAAVYLCGDSDDLSTAAGREAAVLMYNNSTSYLATVLAVRKAYGEGEPANVVPAVGAVDLSAGSAGAAPAGSAPLTGQAQDAADQQTMVAQQAADRRTPAAGGPQDTGSRGGQGADGPDRTPTGAVVRTVEVRGGNVVSSGENVAGGGTSNAPSPGPDPVPPTGPTDPTGPEPTSSPEPATPEPATPQPEPEAVVPEITCLADEFVLADGRVLSLDDLAADPQLYADPVVLDELTALGFVPLCTVVDAG